MPTNDLSSGWSHFVDLKYLLSQFYSLAPLFEGPEKSTTSPTDNKTIKILLLVATHNWNFSGVDLKYHKLSLVSQNLNMLDLLQCSSALKNIHIIFWQTQVKHFYLKNAQRSIRSFGKVLLNLSWKYMTLIQWLDVY